jgi:phosphoserine phosphatase RsbU/P
MRQLESAGYIIDEAIDGYQAMEKIRANAPSLLLCDWMMPGVSGPEICNTLKANPETENIYCLMLSSRNQKDDIVEALDAGADDFMRKPWDKKELLARIRTGLRIESLQHVLALRSTENEHLAERLNDELENVAGIQRSMLPLKWPEHETIEFFPFYMPCTEAGGDYYDIVQMSDGKIGITICDISGHGAPATVTMGIVRHVFHILIREKNSPAELLNKLNQILYDDLTSDAYATMFFGIFDPVQMTFTYTSAGHNPPALFRARTGKAEPLPKCQGFPLKLVARDAGYRENTIKFAPGDRLVCYTDGIVEVMNEKSKMYGLERLLQCIQKNAHSQSLSSLQTEIISEVLNYREGKMPDDDITLVLVGIKG